MTHARLAEAIADRLSGGSPHVVGITGPVAVGKSTIARELADAFGGRGRRVDVVATDAFLHPNSVLEERGLMMRKGFPESFDLGALLSFVKAVKAGAKAETPVYSHIGYDIVPGERVSIPTPDLVIVEGVIALHEAVVPLLDVTLYIDAVEADVRRWFVERFLTLTQAARSGEESFYRMFAGMDDEQVKSVAESVWDSVNGVNLVEHVLPTRAHATLLVEKDSDHSILRVRYQVP